MENDDRRSAMPDEFDRLYGALDGLPDVTKVRESTVTVVPPLGVGGTRTFIVQTVRQRHDEKSQDVVFLQMIGASGSIRLAIPAAVADVIARQRDALTTITRKKVARSAAADRKARGQKPGFKMTPAERAEAKRNRERKGK